MCRRNVHGLTLIELMVAGVLMTLVSAGTFALLARAWGNEEALLVQNEVQRNARAACDLVCDAIRARPTWNPQITIAWSDPQYSMIGSTSQSEWWDIHVTAENPSRLVRITPPYSEPGIGSVLASVSDIVSLRVLFTGMDMSGGALNWPAQPIWLQNLPDAPDPQFDHVVAATITVTAAKTSMYGVTYTSTVSSTVKIRAQAFTLAPP